MNIADRSHQVKQVLDEAMSYPEYAKKISDKVNEKLSNMGYSDRNIKTFLLHKQLKLNKESDRLDVVLNDRHLFYVVVSEIKVGSYRSYSVEAVD